MSRLDKALAECLKRTAVRAANSMPVDKLNELYEEKGVYYEVHDGKCTEIGLEDEDE